jgi:hypothetical protein
VDGYTAGVSEELSASVIRILNFLLCIVCFTIIGRKTVATHYYVQSDFECRVLKAIQESRYLKACILLACTYQKPKKQKTYTSTCFYKVKKKTPYLELTSISV